MYLKQLICQINAIFISVLAVENVFNIANALQ